MALPSGYTPLEYIESTGSQYVDTGFKPNGNTKMTLDVAMLADLTTKNLNGVRNSASDATNRFGIVIYTATNLFVAFFGPFATNLNATDTKRHLFVLGADECTVDGTPYDTPGSQSFSCSYNLPLLSWSNGSGGQVPISGRLYGCKLYNDGVVGRNFLPCTNPSGEVGLYDSVNGVFYGDAAGVGFVAGPVAIYTELEYIESTGTQYVDTKFVPNQDARVTVDFEAAANASGNVAFFGARQGTSSSTFAVWLASGAVNLQYGSVAYNTKTLTLDYVKRLTYDFNKNIFAVGGQTATFETATFSAGATLCLLSVNTAGTVDSRMSAGKLYSCQIYDNGTLVRDYIPVQRLDGAVGLLDKVNNVFCPDAAGGNLIPGPLAAKPEAPASLEVMGTTRNAAALAWPGALVGQNYRLYRDGVVVYEGSALCYTDAGLAAGSAHIYSVHTVIGSTESEGVTAEATTTEGIVLITDRTAADVSARRRKGYYNALDLIRVGEAMAYLEERFAAVGISVTVSPKLDWQLSDIPTHAQTLHYLEDLGVLRDKLLEYRETVILPGSLTALTWGRANDIETILLDVENLIHTIILSYRHYTGRAISGVNALP